MKKVIIIRGPLGSGKTTISKLIADKINANYYSIDNVLERYNLDLCDDTLDCKCI